MSTLSLKTRVNRFHRIGVVHVLIVEAKIFDAKERELQRSNFDTYCMVSLGREKTKTNTYKNSTNPKWREGLDLFWYDETDDILQIIIMRQNNCEKDDMLGQLNINVREFCQEVSHDMWLPIEEECGYLNTIITISGTSWG